MYSASASSTTEPPVAWFAFCSASIDGRLRDAERAHAVRIEDDLVLAHHAADAGDFGDVRHRLQLELQEPVVERPKLTEVLRAAAVDQRVLVDPADAGRVRPERGARAGRQATLHLVEVLDDARAGPVRIGLVVEQDVDEGVAEERIAAHRLGAGDAQHRRGHRIGDQVLDDLRRLAGEGRADDDLRVGEIRQGVERRLGHRPDARGDQERRRDQDQEAIDDRPANEGGDHFVAPEAILCTSTSSYPEAAAFLEAEVHGVARAHVGERLRIGLAKAHRHGRPLQRRDRAVRDRERVGRRAFDLALRVVDRRCRRWPASMRPLLKPARSCCRARSASAPRSR